MNNKTKLDYECKLAENVKKDSKSFYAYVRSKQRNKVRVGPLKNSLGQDIVDNKDTAELLNNYFSSVFTLENTKNVPIPEQIFKGD